MTQKTVEVAVGVIKSGSDIFISKRHESQHQGGFWEFPGGKIEHGETVEAALSRELLEEVNISVVNSVQLQVIEHDYGDKCVRLVVHLVENYEGEPRGLESQECRWVNVLNLHEYAFPEANKSIVAKLQGELL